MGHQRATNWDRGPERVFMKNLQEPGPCSQQRRGSLEIALLGHGLSHNSHLFFGRQRTTANPVRLLEIVRVHRRAFANDTAATATGYARALHGATAAYLLGGRLAEVFSAGEWWTTLDSRKPRMSLGGMPSQVAADDREDMRWYGPGQVPIATEQAEDLSRAGFAALCGDDTPYAFIMAQTARRPGRYEYPEVNEAAEAATRLVNVMAMTRLAQHVRKVAVHFAKQGDPREALERHLNDWIRQYLCQPGETDAPADDRRRPLNEANIELVDNLRAPDRCLVRFWMRPNLPGEGSFGTVGSRIVFALPYVHGREV